MRRLLSVAGDAGGAEALAPVLATLAADPSVSVHALAYGPARAVFARHGIDCTQVPDAAAAAVLAGEGLDVLLVATSVDGPEHEKAYLAAARRTGVPSLAVVDYWSSYRRRFETSDGRLVQPDRIAVVDARMAAEMAAEGFDPCRIAITGAPHHDGLAATRAAFTEQRRGELRRSAGAVEGERLVLFASQPLGSFYGAALGYDELQVLSLLLDALAEIRAGGTPVRLCVRPHPREDASRLARLVAAADGAVVSAAGGGHEWALASDLVVGMTSALLVESCLLGRVTVSLQPGLRGHDSLPTNRTGESVAVLYEDEVRPALERALLDESWRGEHQCRLRPAGGGATLRVHETLFALMPAGIAA